MNRLGLLFVEHNKRNAPMFGKAQPPQLPGETDSQYISAVREQVLVDEIVDIVVEALARTAEICGLPMR